MSRSDLERLAKEELIELVLKLHRPEKTSRTSSKPPASDSKEWREKSRPGGAKPVHEGHKRELTADPDQVVEHRPVSCSACGEVLAADLPAEVISVHEPDRHAARSPGDRAATAALRDLPGLPDPGRRPAAGRRGCDAVRAKL